MMKLSSTEQRKPWVSYVGRAAALLLVITLSILVFAFRAEVEKFAAFGYPGLFLFTFLAYASVILPAPGVVVVFEMGAIFNPFWVGVVAGAGATLGELSGYAVGYSGQSVIENVALYRRMRAWMEKSRWTTFAALVILSAIPNPAADLVGIAAGALRVPIPHYLFARLIGETLKMWVMAYAGAYLLNGFVRFF